MVNESFEKEKHQIEKLSLGQVEMQQFVGGVQRHIPPDELEELLSFEIIPSKVLDEANMLSSLQSSAANLRHTYDAGAHDQVSDDQFRQIATQAAHKSWPKLALALGFLEYDIEAYKLKNNNDPAATVNMTLIFSNTRSNVFFSVNRCLNFFECGVSKKAV